MTEAQALLFPAAILSSVSAVSKKALFQQLGLLTARVHGLDADRVVERLTERERLGSTGFGGGIAIPHGKLEGLEHGVALFARLSQPIDFDAIDGLPVDLVFMLLSPSDAGAEHLKALASISRLLRNRGFVAKLRGAANDDALYALFAESEARDAA